MNALPSLKDSLEYTRMNIEFKNGELREYLRRVFKGKYLVADSAPSTFQELNASKTATALMPML